MSYKLDAGLDGSRPYLRVLEAESGSVRLAWTYDRDGRADTQADAECQLQALFGELYLLTTADYLKGR